MNPNYVPHHTWAEWSKAAILKGVSQFGPDAVLYGSGAFNLYMPYQFQLQTQDLDFFLIVDSPNDFEEAVSRIVVAVQENLTFLSGGVVPSTSVHMKFSSGECASDKHVTMSLAVNGRHVADFSRQLAKNVHTLRTLFPVKHVNVLNSNLGAFSVHAIALEEVKHRLVATVHCLPYLDGAEALPARTNGWRIKKDTPRLHRLLDLEALGRISSNPSDLYLEDQPLFATQVCYVEHLSLKVKVAMPVPLTCIASPVVVRAALEETTTVHAHVAPPVRAPTRNASTSTADTYTQDVANRTKRRQRLADLLKTIAKFRNEYKRAAKLVREDLQSMWSSMKTFVVKECQTVEALAVRTVFITEIIIFFCKCVVLLPCTG